MVTRITVSRIVLVLVLLAATHADALEIIDNNYQLETVATFTGLGGEVAHGMDFGPDGNLYVTSFQSVDGYDGVIFQVQPDTGAVQTWATGLQRPWDIIWDTSATYGDAFYVTEAWDTYYSTNGAVIRIETDTTSTAFCTSGMHQPITLAVDTTGNYGGYMYAVSGGTDIVSRILPNGTAQDFLYFGDAGGGFKGLGFDPTGRYGDAMFLGGRSSTLPNLSGLFSVAPNGDMTRFSPTLLDVERLDFDTSADQLFDGDLLALARDDLAGYFQVFRVAPDGVATKFTQYSNDDLQDLAIGPDGNLYLLQSAWNDTDITVYRISAIPEPLTIAFLASGMVVALRRHRRRD